MDDPRSSICGLENVFDMGAKCHFVFYLWSSSFPPHRIRIQGKNHEITCQRLESLPKLHQRTLVQGSIHILDWPTDGFRWELFQL